MKLLASTLVTALALLLPRTPTRAQSAVETFRIDPSKSHATIHVGKAGVFSFAAGHTHAISAPIETGSVNVDPNDLTRSHIDLTIEASALSVVAKGEPPNDVPKVQEAMLSEKVLDAARHPTIAFRSDTVRVVNRAGSDIDLSVAGRLTIRGVTRTVAVPVHVSLTTEALTAMGTFVITQTAYGITPISVGGLVAVKDALDISFTIEAHR